MKGEFEFIFGYVVGFFRSKDGVWDVILFLKEMKRVGLKLVFFSLEEWKFFFSGKGIVFFDGRMFMVVKELVGYGLKIIVLVFWSIKMVEMEI